MTGILAWIALGLIAGVIAKLLMPGDDPGGFIITTLIGIVGAVVGGFVGSALLGTSGIDDFDVGTIVTAIVGSLLVLGVYRLVAGGGDGE